MASRLVSGQYDETDVRLSGKPARIAWFATRKLVREEIIDMELEYSEASNSKKLQLKQPEIAAKMESAALGARILVDSLRNPFSYTNEVAQINEPGNTTTTQ